MTAVRWLMSVDGVTTTDALSYFGVSSGNHIIFGSDAAGNNITLKGMVDAASFTVQDSYRFSAGSVGSGLVADSLVIESGSLGIAEGLRVEAPTTVFGGAALLNKGEFAKTIMLVAGASLISGKLTFCEAMGLTPVVGGFSVQSHDAGLQELVLQPQQRAAGSTTLGTTLDFSGATISRELYDQLRAGELESLNRYVAETMFGVDADVLAFSYEMSNYALADSAASFADGSFRVGSGNVSVTGSTTGTLSLGSYNAGLAGSAANLQLSELAGGAIEAAGVDFATLAGETTTLAAGSQVTTRSLEVVAGSTLCNDGSLAGAVAVAGTLLGCGQFGDVVAQAGATVAVGEGPGAADYGSLTLQQGASLVFTMDGTAAATEELSGTGSGTHSVLTLTGGSLLVESGAAVKLGFTSDFIAATEGTPQTLTLISGVAADEALLAALQGSTGFYYVSAQDGSLTPLAEETNYTVRRYAWEAGADGTIDFSFTLGFAYEGTLTWGNWEEDGRWNNSSENWTDEAEYSATFPYGMTCRFTDEAAGTVILEGALDPDAVVVETDADYVFTGSGSIINGTLTKAGSGTLRIETANSYAGGTTLQAGRLELGHAEALGAGEVALEGGTLDLGGFAAGNAIRVTGVAVLDGGAAYGGQLVLDGGALTGGSIGLAQDALLHEGSIANALVGAGGVIKEGTGSVTLTGANRYTGTTQVKAGRLALAGTLTGDIAVGTDAVLAATRLTLTPGQQLQLAAGATLDGSLTTVSGTTVQAGPGAVVTGTLTLGGGTLSFDALAEGGLTVGGLVLGSASTVLQVGDAATLGTGSYTLISFGGAAPTGSLAGLRLDLSGVDGSRSSYELSLGATSLELIVSNQAATLLWDASQSVWAQGETGDAWLAGGSATLYYNGDSVTFEGGSVSMMGKLQPGSLLVRGDADTTLGGEGSIAGAASLVKQGRGTLTMGTDNSFSGGSRLEGGLTVMGHRNALGSGEVTLAGGALDMGGFAVENEVVARGVNAIYGGAAYAGRLTLDGSVVSGDTLRLAQDALLLSGSLSNDLTGEGGVVKSGEGSVSLWGENTYSGGTQVTAGTLCAGGDHALGTGSVQLSGGELDMGGHALDNAVTVAGRAVLTGGGTYAGKLTLENGALTGDAIRLAQDATLLSGTVMNDLTGPGGVVKSGSGTAMLCGTNSYEGLTQVAGGMLYLSSAAGDIHVSANATLAASGLALGAGQQLHLDGGATLRGSLSTAPGARLSFADGAQVQLGCTLTLGGGTFALAPDGQLAFGTVSTTGTAITLLEVESLGTLAAGSYTLFTGSDLSGLDTSLLSLDSTGGNESEEYSLVKRAYSLDLVVGGDSASLVGDEDEETTDPGSSTEPDEGEVDSAPARRALAAQLGANQRRAYAALCGIADGGKAAGELAQLAQTVAAGDDIATLRSLLDRFDGAAYATAMSSQVEGNLAHLRLLRSRMGTGQAVDGAEGRTAAYVSAVNSYTSIDADAHGQGYTRDEWGGQLGAEYRADGGSLYGFALTAAHARLNPTGGSRAREDSTSVALYVQHHAGAWTFRTLLGAGLHDHEYKVPGGYSRTQMDGSSFNVAEDISYTVALQEDITLQAYATVESSVNRIDSFREPGRGSASLCGERQSAWATDISLGLRYNQSFDLVGAAGPASFNAHVGATASIGDLSDTLRLHYAGAPGHAFSQTPAERNRWAMSLGAGLTVPLTERTSVFAAGDALLRGDSTSIDAQLGVNVAF